MCAIFPGRLLWAATLAIFVGSGAKAQTWSDKLTTTPSLIQVGFGPLGSDLSLDGERDCAVTAMSMSLLWLARNGFTQLAPVDATFAEQLALMREISGVYSSEGDGIPAQMTLFLQLRGIAAADIEFRTRLSPDVAWIQENLQDQSIVNVEAGWFDGSPSDPQPWTRNGQHYMTPLTTDPDNNAIVINNPAPGVYFKVPPVPGSNPQTIPLVPLSHPVSQPLPADRPTYEYNVPEARPEGTSHAVLIEGIALKIAASARASLPGWQPATCVLAGQRSLSTYTSTMRVIAPLAGPGGLRKTGSGRLELLAGNTSEGEWRVEQGTVGSNARSGSPLGRGHLELGGAGSVALVPAGRTAGALALASAAGSRLAFSGGNEVLFSPRGLPAELVIGGNQDGRRANLLRRPGGALVLATTQSLSAWGRDLRIRVRGARGNLPERRRGMVSPAIVGRGGGGRLTFLDHGTEGFVPAAGVPSARVPLDEADPRSIYRVDGVATMTGREARVSALAVERNGRVRSRRAGGTLHVGNARVHPVAAVILNGGTIATGNLDFGSAEAVIHAGRAGGRIRSRLRGRRGLVVAGGGTLALAGRSALRGPLAVQSGTLRVERGGRVPGAVNVGSEAALDVSGEVGAVSVASLGSVTFAGGSAASLDLRPGLSPGGLLQDGGALAGTGTIRGPAWIAGQIGWRRTPAAGLLNFRGPVTFAASGVFVMEWALSALTDAPSQRGAAWNALDFEGPVDFGSGATNYLLLRFPGVDDPNSGNAFWTVPREWELFRFAGTPPSIATWKVGGRALINGSFSLVPRGNSVWLTYSPADAP